MKIRKTVEPAPEAGLRCRGQGRLWAGLLIALGLSLPVRSAQAPAEDDGVELRLWNVPQKTSTNPVHVANRRVFEAFFRANPNIRPRALVPLKIEGPAQEGNEFLAVAGGVAPDVFLLFGRKIGDYNEQGFLHPLNEYLAEYADRMDTPYSGVAAPSQVWELCYDQGRIVAVPGGYYSMALQCNNAAFARAGLAGRFPRDWQEMYEFARRMTWDPDKEPDGREGDVVQYGVRILTGIYAGWHYLQYVWSAGGDVVQSYYPLNDTLHPVSPPPIDYRQFHIRISNEERYEAERLRDQADLEARGLPLEYSISDLEWRLETDSPEAIQALHFYRKLATQPWLRNEEREFDITPEMFEAGVAVDPHNGQRFDLRDPEVQTKIYWGVSDASAQQAGAHIQNVQYAMTIGTLGEADQADPTRVTFVPFPPRTRDLPPAAFIAGHYLGINAAIQPEDREGRRDVDRIREAAWAYIEFFTGPEAERIRVETFVEYGLSEFIRPALLELGGYGDLLDRIPPERRALWDNLAADPRVEPYSRGFTHVMTRELGLAIEAILGDSPDPFTGIYRRDPQRVMDEVVQNVNTMILGRMPEAEVQRRSRIGWIIFGVMAFGLALGARMIVRLAMHAQAKVRDSEGFGVGGHPGRRRLYAWIFLLPAVLCIAIWNYVPLARGLIMAFQDYRILGGSTYVGLRNFIEALSNPQFWRYLMQTVQYMVMLVGIGFAVPILLAALLTEIPKAKVFYRTLYYLPAVTTGIVTLFLWKNLIYDPTRAGVINRFILWFNTWPPLLVGGARLVLLAAAAALISGLFSLALRPGGNRKERLIPGLAGAIAAFLLISGIVRTVTDAGMIGAWQGLWTPFDFKIQSFLRDPSLALLWVVVPVIWAGAGPGCLIYLAALKGIPEEQYEAADIDGAGLWQKLIHVTYPNLKALIMINFIGAVVAGFKASSNIFVMTGGGPEDATMTIGLNIWFNAFMFLNFGLATAMGWVMGALLIGFTLTQLRILNKLQFRSAAVEETAAGGRA